MLFRGMAGDLPVTLKRMKYAALVFLIAAPLSAQPSLSEQDANYGFNLHQKILRTNTVIESGEAQNTVFAVFSQMAQTDLVRNSSAPTPQVFYLRTSIVNAYATFGGRLYVTEGLMNATQGDPGRLAFVIGHEMAHNMRQHLIQKYLRNVASEIAYRAIRNNWARIGFQVAHRIAEKKIAREEENEADKIGLFIAAQAGYHPDFAISAARTLRSSAGELSKVGAFFADHPRWQTREQRAERNRAEALRFFQSKWRSAAESPGGVPPTVVVFSAPSSGEKSKGDFRASMRSEIRMGF